jgi:hypothetical protein
MHDQSCFITHLIGLFTNTLDYTYFCCLPLDRLSHLRGFPLIAEIYAHQEYLQLSISCFS